MNYLAHLYFTDSSDYNVVGNFIADAVKGSQIKKYPENIVAGIKMHRFIDAFTDSHHVVKQSIMKLRNDFRKYSGVVADIYYDHFLSRKWNKYNDTESIEDFAKRKLQVIENHRYILPDRSLRMFEYLKRNNRLVTYRSFDGLNATFTEMSQRVAFVSNLENAAGFLFANYRSFEEDFVLFFDDLISFVEEYKDKLSKTKKLPY